ncbi:MAG: flagellar filament outer layer protein FlaA [Treponema sp.]|jgi:hypothetical protein|nr:flagellar filament outer layer protein FlaA [Treponema sp.]
MKKIFILIVIALLAGPLFADQATLVDFTLLKADIHVKVNENDQDSTPNQNRQTMMNFANVAGSSFTQEQKNVMKTSLAINNWEILLASSSRSVENIGKSYTKEALSKGYFNNQETTVMGVRVHFPVEPFNSWAIIKPPFEIPAFEPQADISDDGSITRKEGSDGITGPSRFESQSGKDEDYTPAYGVVKNVGIIKSIKVQVYGLNFPHSLSTIIIDSTGVQKNIFMGHLRFDGWGELIWQNPSYVQEVRNREIRLFPLYPDSTPFVKFGGFLVQRDAANTGGDFITYFKDVEIIYDRAVITPERDIDDEGLWNIIYDRETARKTWEMERFGQNQVLRYLETQKQASEQFKQREDDYK